MASDIRQSGNVVSNLTTSKSVQRAQKDTQPIQQFLRKFNNDWSMQFAGSLAYSLLTAMLPIAIAIIAIAGFVLSIITGNQNSGQAIMSQMQNIPGLSGAQGDLLQSATNRLQQSAGFLAIIAIALAIFGGSRLFVAMEGCMDIVYRVRPRKPIMQNIMAIVMMIIFTLLVPIMIFAATLPSTILNIINSNPAFKSIPVLSTIAENGFTILLVGYFGGLLAAFILFWVIYTVVPNQKISLGHSVFGAIAAAIALEIFIALFPLYTSHFLGSYVGQIGFAVVLLVFFYYFAVILMLGAEVNAYFFEGVKPLPNDLATFVSTMAGELNQDRPESESESHVDPHPTIQEDKSYIGRTREQEEHTTRENAEKQQKIALQNREKHEKPQEKEHPQQSGKIPATVSVIIGSTLAFIVELIRLRQHGK